MEREKEPPLLPMAAVVDDACTLVEDRPYECRCDVCGAKSMYPTTAWRFCPCCGRRIAGYRWCGERDEEARDA